MDFFVYKPHGQQFLNDLDITMHFATPWVKITHAFQEGKMADEIKLEIWADYI